MCTFVLVGRLSLQGGLCKFFRRIFQPVFLTKEQRAAEALRKRQEESELVKKKQEEERKKRIEFLHQADGGHGSNNHRDDR